MNNLETIYKLINAELKAANDKFPPFQNRHEAYAVMLEELEETKEELKDIETGLKIDYWNFCRKSKAGLSKETLHLLNCMYSAVICSMQELIQLGAMIKKSMKLEDEKNENLSG